MITKTEKKAFKKILGNYYTAKVIAVLEENNITDTSGNTHSSSFITNVMNGVEHEEIEKAILEATKIEKKNQAQLKRLKARILKSA